jgi:hypothetical protein
LIVNGLQNMQSLFAILAPFLAQWAAKKGDSMGMSTARTRESMVDLVGGLLASALIVQPLLHRCGFDPKTAEIALICCLAHTVACPILAELSSKFVQAVYRRGGSLVNTILVAAGPPIIRGAAPLAVVAATRFAALKTGRSVSWSECCAIGVITLYVKKVFVTALDKIVPGK